MLYVLAQQFLSLPGTDINTKRTKATAVSLVNTIIEVSDIKIDLSIPMHEVTCDMWLTVHVLMLFFCIR